jgi:hypothetical protein
MMPQVVFRLPAEQLAEAERLAAVAGVSVSTWLRALVEEAAGIETPLIKRGFGGMSPAKAKRIQDLGLKAFQKASKRRAKAKDKAEGK